MKKLYYVNFLTFSFLLLTPKAEAQTPVCFLPAANFAVGINSKSIVGADFNNDGKADYATASYNMNSVSVFFGNGLGSFGSATTLAVGYRPSAIISGDFNGDGNVDLVTANPYLSS